MKIDVRNIRQREWDRGMRALNELRRHERKRRRIVVGLLLFCAGIAAAVAAAFGY